MENTKTITTTIRMTPELRERIRLLANKRMCSVNKWIVRTLDRESKPRN